MKIIKYKFLSCVINHGTKDAPDHEQVILEKEIYCGTDAILEANLSIAQKEALGGVYTVEDDGQPEADTLSPEERIAELEEALDMLLNGVTE